MGIELSYIRNGVERSLDAAELDPALSRPVPLVLRKALAFRPVQQGRRNDCRH